MGRASGVAGLGGLLAAVIVFGAVAWAQVPAPVNPVAPPQPADPRAERVRAELQRRGFRVLEVKFKTAQGRASGSWAVATEANYVQPARDPVLRQAFATWDVVFTVASRDLPNTLMVVTQAWDKYLITFVTDVHDYRELVDEFRSAQSPEEKAQIIEVFLADVEFAVYDVERQRDANRQDFINKYLTR